jgi:hypothetical protein
VLCLLDAYQVESRKWPEDNAALQASSCRATFDFRPDPRTSDRAINAEQRAFGNLALLFSVIPDLPRWTPDEKAGLLRIVQAKASGEESHYLTLLQSHSRLRRALLAIGSR